jgi:hypothetical protein
MLLIDTDVLIKCSCYSLLDQIGLSEAVEENRGILGAARYMVMNYLEKRGKINDRAGAQRRFAEFSGAVTILEPTEEELALASAIEEAGVRLDLDLDVGESQLCAIAIMRDTPRVLTGDKRAIVGLESMQQEIPRLTELRGRIACLEQALMAITKRIGARATREKVCAESQMDKSLTICFECRSPGNRADFSPDGLESYVRSLRSGASTLLYAVEVV